MSGPKVIESKEKKDDLFLEAIKDPNIPKVYANGFMNALGNGDSTLVFQWNGNPVLVLNMSFTLSKTLALKLGNMIGDIEKGSGNTIMITDEIARALKLKPFSSKNMKDKPSGKGKK